jgi:hypothetical protein
MQASTGVPTAACAGRPRGRRKTLFVNPGFQWRYAGLIAGGVFIVALLMCTVMYGVLYEQARQRMLYLAPRHDMENTFSLVLFAGIFALIMSAAFGLWGIVVSQRICGPLYVMEGQLKELATGRIPHTRALRRGDEFQSFYASMRTAMDHLRTGRREELSALGEALELVCSVQNGPETVRAQALSALRDRLESFRSQAAAALGEAVEPIALNQTAPARRAAVQRETVGAAAE